MKNCIGNKHTWESGKCACQAVQCTALRVSGPTVGARCQSATVDGLLCGNHRQMYSRRKEFAEKLRLRTEEGKSPELG